MRTNTSPLSGDEALTPPTTEELLARLPPLPDVKRPYLTPDDAARMTVAGDSKYLKEMISGRYLDFMLDELLVNLPDVSQRVADLGAAGLTLQARPSSTINALTVPTRDGVMIIYNLGLYDAMIAFARAVSLALDQHDARQATEWLSSLVDWATSRAKEPRLSTPLEIPEKQDGLAANLAGQAQRFAMCHELGHVMTFNRAEPAIRTATIANVVVKAVPDSWEKEYSADRDGLAMFIRALISQGKSEAAALIGAEVFLNAAGMLQESSKEEGADHPPADDRLAEMRSQFLQACGERAPELARPSKVVRTILAALRGFVTKEVRQRRAETTRHLSEAHQAYAARVSVMTKEEYRAAAHHLSRFLTDSPGATLDFLYEKIFAPKGIDEPDGGSPGRILAVNAALHFKKPLQDAIELSRLQF